MTFLGRKLRGSFEGEIVSDLSDFSGRIPGCRIKHRVKENWIKMYDKSGLVLRVETVINNPEEFRVRKRVTRKGKTTRRMGSDEKRRGLFVSVLPSVPTGQLSLSGSACRCRRSYQGEARP